MGDEIPQFTTAEYAVKPEDRTCKVCSQTILGAYYRLNGAPACATCTEQIRSQMTEDPHHAFVRSVIFGIGGALLGLIIYVTATIATGLELGLVSLAVGFIVGKVMMIGSKGRGGRRYQIAAAVLTYMAVSLSAVPIAIYQHEKHEAAQRQAHVGEASSVDQGGTPVTQTIGLLALVGLASPFLSLSDPLHGVIGLVILFVGVRIAWRLTAGAKLNFSGPIDAAATVV